MTTLALVAPAPAAPDTTPAPLAPASDDALTPEAILRTLATEIAGNPFATGKRPNAVRVAGTTLQAALGKVAAARDHLRAMEADADAAALRALAVLTGDAS